MIKTPEQIRQGLAIGAQDNNQDEGPMRSYNGSTNNDINRTSRSTYHGDGRVTYEQSGVTRGSTAEIPVGSDVFVSARSATGSEQTISQVTDDSVVRLQNGIEAKLGSLIQAGLVERTPDGRYVEGKGDTQTQYNGEEHEDLQGEAFSDATVENEFGEFLGATDTGTQIAAVQAYVKEGEINERLIGQLASQARTEPHVIQQHIDKVRGAFEQQANAKVSALGVQPEAVWQYAHEHQPQALQEAMHRHATLRNADGYEAIARSYVRDLEKHNPGAILNAQLGDGIKSVHQDHKGRVVLTDHQDRTFTWSEAVRAGVVSVGKAR
jgi:hypothetical protein